MLCFCYKPLLRRNTLFSLTSKFQIRRYGFHKKTLAGLCGKIDIDYAHFPELGIQSKKRKNLETPEDYDILFEEYGRTVLKNEKKAIEKVADLTTERLRPSGRVRLLWGRMSR
jgi:uncharacterized protein (DUF488 family)